ncbi:hypothetical protein G7Y89_g3279 [Cudoniella acicularis]|uniref:SprT-like domain-containing protein n=1 Tax=Cudoniella acicularis TaxID=354080 RepID=A0A8H4W7U0_9HELO|nr:hypothetical protein G7Y89_g3279 [Cudoniella acicularis]
MKFNKTPKTEEKEKHRHKSIRFSCIIEECVTNELAYNRYNASSLSGIIVTLCKVLTEDPTPLQKRALSYFRRNPVFNLLNDIEDVLDVKVVERYFEIFSDLFFFSSLKEHCEVNMSERQAVDVGHPGHCSPVRIERPRVSLQLAGMALQGHEHQEGVRITLYRRDMDSRSRQERLTMYLGTMLHEMVHAFLNLWACHSRKCRARSFEKIGEFDHGVAWQEIAHAVETAANSAELNLGLSLRRKSMLLSEVVKSKMELSEAIVLSEWGMDYAEVERELRSKKRSRHGEDVEERGRSRYRSRGNVDENAQAHEN